MNLYGGCRVKRFLHHAPVGELNSVSARGIGISRTIGDVQLLFNSIDGSIDRVRLD